MTDAALPSTPLFSPMTRGLVYGAIGVAIFGGSLPATRAAVLALKPWFVSAARAVGAAILGGLWLLATRHALPSARDFLRLALVGLCVVIGFPVLTGLALRWG